MNDAGPEVEQENDDDYVLRMSRVFDAPREAVFRAWTDVEAFASWWGPEGCTATAELDPRPGGAWRTRMLHASGKEHVLGGTYREIVPPERLVFTWAWETVVDVGYETTVTLEFHDRAGKTELVLTQRRFEKRSHRDEHNQGWIGCLNCLAIFLAERGYTA